MQVNFICHTCDSCGSEQKWQRHMNAVASRSHSLGSKAEKHGAAGGVQITLQMQVDRSRRVCEAVARGETDVAVVGGEVPNELCDVLQVQQYH